MLTATLPVSAQEDVRSAPSAEAEDEKDPDPDIDPGDEEEEGPPAEELDPAFVHSPPADYRDGAPPIEPGVFPAPSEMAPAPVKDAKVVGGRFEVRFSDERSALESSPIDLQIVSVPDSDVKSSAEDLPADEDLDLSGESDIIEEMVPKEVEETTTWTENTQATTTTTVVDSVSTDTADIVDVSRDVEDGEAGVDEPGEEAAADDAKTEAGSPASTSEPEADEADDSPTVTSKVDSATPVSPVGATTTTEAAPPPATVKTVEPTKVPALERAVVTVLDEKVLLASGLEKVAFTIETPEVNLARVESSTVRITIRYDEFRDAYGGDWPGRLQLVQFHSCWLDGLARDFCKPPERVASFVNDPMSGVITAEVDLLKVEAAVAPFGPAGEGRFAPTGASGFGLSAAAHSSTGNYGASDLSSSSSWTVGLSAGNFSWSYPISTPAPPAGSAPQLGVSYNSQAIDGLTSDENTQGGPLGPGWSMGDAFIERSYKSCGSNGGYGGDLCYVDDNATLSMAGASGRLIEISTATSPVNSAWEIKTYQLEDHSGWRIEKYRRNNLTTSRGALHQDNDREYWRIRDNNGVEYVFGYGKESGVWSPGTDLKSVDTVPVRSVDSGGNFDPMPCENLSYDWCHQAYRWNLDRVTDANGRVTTYSYTPFVNYVNIASYLSIQPYVASSVPYRIEYGQLTSNVDVAGAYTNLVRFFYDYRCNNSTSCPTAPNSSNGSDFPDIPNDHICSPSSCSKATPTFFEARKLLRVQKYSRKADASVTYTDSELFSYEWTDADGAGSSPQRLWLRNIQHVGQQSGTDLALPAIRFDSSAILDNRVDHNEPAGVSRMKWFRLNSVRDEIGGQIFVEYGQAGLACPSPLPAWNNNSYACYPRYWSPSGTVHDGFGIWHKYVVERVEVRDQSGGGPTISYDYDYKTSDLTRNTGNPTSGSGGMGWHSDRSQFANDPLPPKWYHEGNNAWYSTLTWGDYRGFSEVTVTVGGSDPTRSRSTHRFYRGMHDDITSHSNASAPRTDVQLTDSQGTTWDDNRLSGRQREQFTRGVGSYNVEYSGEITSYRWWTTSGTNGSATEVAVKNVRSRLHGGVEFYKSFTHDSNRRLIAERDYADTSANDNRCTLHTYSAPTTLFPDGLLTKTETYSDIQSVSPYLCAGTELTDNRWTYDAYGKVITAKTQIGDSTSVFDSNGNGVSELITSTDYEPSGWRRPIKQTDSIGNVTNTTYESFAGSTPLSVAANHVTKKITVTNAIGHTTVTTLDYWGNPTSIVDPDGREVRTCYDVLGRVWKVFLPGDYDHGCTSTGPASIEHTYTHTQRPSTTQNDQSIQAVNPTFPSWRIDTKTLFSKSNDAWHVGSGSVHYTHGAVFLDGLGRTIEQWATAPAPAANHITFTRYDARGNVFGVSEPQGTSLSSAAGAYSWNNWYSPATVHVEMTTRYDPAGRPILHQARDNDVPLREATTSYSGLKTTSEPFRAIGAANPYASTRTTRDAFGNVTKIEEFSSTGGTAVTSKQYSERDELTSITNPNGSTVTWMQYNRLGWPTYTDDDNAGASQITYYQSGGVRTRTDAEQNTTYTTLDAYGRPNSTRVDTATGPLLSETSYDPSGKKGTVNWVKTYDPPGTMAAWEDNVAFDYAGRLTHHSARVYAANSTSTTADNEIMSWQEFHTSYTRRGQIATQTYPGVPGTNLPNDETISYRFNTAALVDRISSPEATGGHYLAAQSFTWAGQPDISEVRGGTAGLDINHNYQSADNRLGRRTATITNGTQNGRQISNEHYTYDDAGNITNIFRDPDIPDVSQLTSEDERECFYYDARQRLTGAHTIGRPTGQLIPECANTHSPSPVGNGPGPYSESFTYDKNLNITSYDGRSYTYNTTRPSGCLAGTDVNKHDAVSNISASNGQPAETLDYDCNGSITTRTTNAETTEYGRNHNNRLDTVTITPNGGTPETSRNLYSASGQRLLRVDSNGDKTVYFGTTELRWNHTAQTVTAARYYPTGSSRGFDNTLQHTATTINNSMAASLNANNSAINQRHYTPYGNPRNGAAINDKGFLNQTEDPDQALVYLNNRHYDPTTGVFVSVDPLVTKTMQPYIYGSANPVMISDPSGLCGCEHFDIESTLPAWTREGQITNDSNEYWRHAWEDVGVLDHLYGEVNGSVVSLGEHFGLSGSDLAAGLAEGSIGTFLAFADGKYFIRSNGVLAYRGLPRNSGAWRLRNSVLGPSAKEAVPRVRFANRAGGALTVLGFGVSFYDSYEGYEEHNEVMRVALSTGRASASTAGGVAGGYFGAVILAPAGGLCGPGVVVCGPVASGVGGVVGSLVGSFLVGATWDQSYNTMTNMYEQNTSGLSRWFNPGNWGGLGAP